MGALVPGAEDALEVSNMARPTQTRHFGRAISFVRGLFGTSRDSLHRQAIDRLLEWFRLVFSPINFHSYFLMATAQIYTQGKLALGLPIAHTPVTRK
jgi:hypothetical protein